MRSLLFTGLSGALLLASAHAENLFENGSFEFPKINGRTPVEKGGNPSLVEEKTSWATLVYDRIPEGEGKLITGITDEIAHTGKQSVFVDFEKITARGKRVALNSDLVPVASAKPYRISLWGRLDKKRPLALDERRPNLLVEVEFFAADQETQVGDTEARVQMIPGSVIPGLGPRLLFSSAHWSEYYTELTSPVDAAFMKVTFSFQTSREAGETDGVIYLDDAIVEGERGTTPLTDNEESDATETGGQTSPAAPGGANAPSAPAKK